MLTLRSAAAPDKTLIMPNSDIPSPSVPAARASKADMFFIIFCLLLNFPFIKE